MINKTKVAINNAVTLAKYHGILKVQPCEKCGTAKNIHAHHDDYNKPLTVRWLCQRCHGKHHAFSMNAIQALPEIRDKKTTFYYKLGIEQMGGKYLMIGAELRQWREERNLTQEFMANVLGVSCPTYKRWESEYRATNNIPQSAAILISLMKNAKWEIDLKQVVL